MAAEYDATETHAYATREENPGLIEHWTYPVVMGMLFTGMTELTKDNIGKFFVRYNVMCAVNGQGSTFGFDPAIVECFIGLKTWGRHHPGNETDAQFFRRMAKGAAYMGEELSRAWESRSPGDVMGNMSLEDKVEGKCATCPSHHTQNLVHDGERTD